MTDPSPSDKNQDHRGKEVLDSAKDAASRSWRDFVGNFDSAKKYTKEQAAIWGLRNEKKEASEEIEVLHDRIGRTALEEDIGADLDASVRAREKRDELDRARVHREEMHSRYEAARRELDVHNQTAPSKDASAGDKERWNRELSALKNESNERAKIGHSAVSVADELRVQLEAERKKLGAAVYEAGIETPTIVTELSAVRRLTGRMVEIDTEIETAEKRAAGAKKGLSRFLFKAGVAVVGVILLVVLISAIFGRGGGDDPAKQPETPIADAGGGSGPLPDRPQPDRPRPPPPPPQQPERKSVTPADWAISPSKAPKLTPAAKQAVLSIPELSRQEDDGVEVFRATGDVEVTRAQATAGGGHRYDVAVKAMNRYEPDEDPVPVTVHVRVIVDEDGDFVSARAVRTETAEDHELERLFAE